MKVVFLALLLCTAGVVAVAPAASACPDPDNPCDPQPIDPFEGTCEKKLNKNLIYCFV